MSSKADRRSTVGNILSLIHTATNGNWNRTYAYANDSNRLATTTVGTTTQTYNHNAHGSFTSMPHLDTMDWTPDERLHHVKRGTSQTWYAYDSTGQRVRKVTEKGGITEERLYLGGFEIYRKHQGTTVTLERETLHLMDGSRRIAMVETKTVDSSPTAALPATVTRYQLDNHLQSASLELDETASVISYEEYYPYGDTSYRSSKSGTEVSEKRYRYTGKEKDEETGLYYHGARYYAAWLGRWSAADPAGMVDGACVYAYVRNHPTGLVDPDGKQSENSAIIDYEHRTEDPNQYYGGRGFSLPPIPPGFRFEAPQTTKTLSDKQIEIIMQHGYRDDPTWNCFDEAKTAVVNAATLEDPKSVLFDSSHKIGYNWVGAPTIPDDQFDLTMEKSPSENMIDYIVKSINKGNPVLAGVNHQQSLLNSKGKPLNEGVTDHWISIYGYKSQQGQITHILAIDNATTDASKIEFSVDPATMEAEKPATDENSRFAADLRFEITQIRLWKGIEPKSKLHRDGYRGK